jgi:hypothetical protein
MTTDPHAMVRPDSHEQKGLLALGWTVTDTLDGWDHMEPPTGAALVFDSPLNMRESDGLIVTADGLDARDVERLREQVDLLLAGHLDALVSSFDIKVQVLRRDPAPVSLDPARPVC